MICFLFFYLIKKGVKSKVNTMMKSTFNQVYKEIDKLVYISNNQTVLNENKKEIECIRKSLVENIQAIELITFSILIQTK